MEKNTVGLIRGVLLSGSLFALLFLLHIVTAANDYANAFRVVALLITAQVLLCGYSIQFFSGLKETKAKHQMNKIGFLISIPLSIGLARAYAGMEFDFTIVYWILATTIFHMSRQYLIKSSER